MKAEDKLELLKEVYVAIAHRDDLEVDNLGSNLAYLLGAILKDGYCEFLRTEQIVRLLGQKFSTGDPVWNFITLE